MITILLSCVIILQDKNVQTIFGRIAAEQLSEKFNAEIKIRELSVSPFLDIILKGVEVNDLKKNKLIESERIQLSFERARLYYRDIVLRRLKIDQGKIDLRIYKNKIHSNIYFLLSEAILKQDSLAALDTTNAEKAKWMINCTEVEVTNSAFSFVDENKEKNDGVDFDHVDIADFNMKMGKLYMKGDSLNFRIKQLSLTELKSGFKIDKFAGDFILSTHLLDARNLKVEAMKSNLDLDFSFTYNSFKDFIDFEQKININTRIRRTRLNLSDIGYFAPELKVMDNLINFNLEAQGSVSNFRSKNIYLDYGELTHFEGDIVMKGLPFIRQTDSEAKIRKLVTSAHDLNAFSLPGNLTYLGLPKEFEHLGRCEVIGDMKGVYNEFKAKIAIKSEVGNLATDMQMHTNISGDSTQYQGNLRTFQFDLGKVLGIEKYMGKHNLDMQFLGKGIDFMGATLELKGVVDSLDLIGNNYNQIMVDGLFAKNKFNGHLSIQDKKLDLKFDGNINFGKKDPVYNFKAKIQNAYLYDLGLYKKNNTAVFSTDLDINFTGSNIDDYIGSIHLDSTRLTQDGKTYFMRNALLNARKLTGNMKRMTLKSDYLDVLVSGEFLFGELGSSVNHQLAVYMPSVFKDSTNTIAAKNQNFEFKIDLKNSSDITEIFFPDLEVPKKALVSGAYYSEINQIVFEAKAEEIVYKGIQFKECYLKTNNDKESFMFLAGCNDMIFKHPTKTDSLALGLENLNVLFTVQNDSIDYRLRWDDYRSEDNNMGYMAGYLKTLSKNKAILKIYRTDFMVNNSNWIIEPNNHIYIDSSRIEFADFVIKSNNQKFNLDGIISKNVNDTLRMYFDNWELSNFDILINNPKIKLNGVLDGAMALTSIYESTNVDANLSINDLIFNNEFLGNANFETIWNPVEKSLYSELVISSSFESNKELFHASGTYYPYQMKDQFDFNLKLNEFSLHTLEPFVENFMNNIKGSASGDLKFAGTRDKPILTGQISMNNVNTRVEYINVNYSINNTIQFKENEIILDDIMVRDSLGNEATTAGKITHNYLSDFNFDFHFYPEFINCLNTVENQNSIFYGRANASGDVHIFGPINQINLDITMETDRGTEVNVPLDYSVEVSDTDYIVFLNKVDTTEEKERFDYKVDLSGVSIDLNLIVNENARINLFLPYGMGNLSANGNSDMQLSINQRGDFEIIGDYVISTGSFNLSMQNLLKRKFDLLEGGKISWNGDPYDALIDVKAIYKTKATPPNLPGLYSGEEVKRKLNVDCYLSLKDQLFDPEMKFRFGLPNIDKQTEQQIYALIDTTNEAVMNQQLIYLLVLGAFNTDQFAQAGIGQSSFKLISNQLSNLITQISKDVDIGINYRPGDDLTSEELEFALSTQLWDNRLTIDGNFGVVGGLQKSSTTASNIVGDVNVEVKLTEDGRFRIRAFNRSNVNAIQSTNIYDNISPYTQGVGIFFRKEFDKFGDVFKKEKEKERNRKKVRKAKNSRKSKTTSG